jgi:hypothetical protein
MKEFHRERIAKLKHAACLGFCKKFLAGGMPTGGHETKKGMNH